jgi:hypothetical protein
MPSLSRSRSSRSASTDPQLLTVSDLSAGIDLRASPSLIKPNRARRLRNWSLQEPGTLLVYPGWASFSTSSLGSRRLQGAQRVYLSSATFSLGADNGNVYKPTDAGVWGSTVLTGLHATNDIYFPHDRDMVGVLDGSNVPKKSTNGSTWTQLGITAPTVAPTAGAVAGGSLTAGNVIEASYTYQDNELSAESNASTTVQATPAGANLRVQVTVTGPADPQVDIINVYARDVTSGETVRRFAGTVANPGSGLTATVDLTSKNWTAAAEEPTDHNVPPALSFAVVWKNRWWARDATVKNRIRFTQIFQNQSWPATFFIDIPFERGDEVAAILPIGDTLVIFGLVSKPFLVIGQTSLDFEVRPSAAAEAGALGPRAVALIENGIVHAAAEGVYIFDGATDRLLSYDIDPGWQDFVAATSQTTLAKTALIYHRKRKELRIAVPRLYPYSTAGEWVLDLNRTREQSTPAWTTTDRTIGGYVHWDGNESTTGNRGRLFSWSDTVAKLFEESTGTTADGSDLATDYEGPAFITGLPVARFLELYGEFQPTAGTFALEVLVDAVSVASLSVNIGAGLSQYGTSTYGTATYAGASRKPFQKMLPLAAEGRSITLRSTYTGQAAFRWFSYAVSVLPEALPRGL